MCMDLCKQKYPYNGVLCVSFLLDYWSTARQLEPKPSSTYNLTSLKNILGKVPYYTTE
jgi:hypothetical protein